MQKLVDGVCTHQKEIVIMHHDRITYIMGRIFEQVVADLFYIFLKTVYKKDNTV